MDWKQKAVMTFTNLKSKKNLCISIAVFVFLSWSLFYAILVNHQNGRKLNAMMKDLETLKSSISANNIKSALVRDKKYSAKLRATGGRSRKRRDVDNNADTVNNLNPSPQGTGGALYTRWGRSQCPANYTDLVYNGVAGGSWYEHTGAATNHQCLPSIPDWGRFIDTEAAAHMYGMEYESSMSGIMDISNVQVGIQDHNVPCSVCRSNVRTSSLMIPAKTTCYKGWHLEYNGYIMAGHYNHKAGTQYICVDEAPEADPAGYRDENGALLYRVTVKCGSLPCPRYVQNRDIPCVVCTK